MLAREAFKVEDFGRLAIEHRLLYDGTWNQRLSEYNAMGWKTSVSEWQPNGTSGGNLRKTAFSGFDPFGRPTTITPPDGTAHNVTLAYLGTRQVTRTVKVNQSGGEANATTTEEYDRQGRLWKVTEPSGSGGANVTSTYTYDVGNRLKQASTVSGGTTQNRIFTYDRRGFLTSEQLPEKGASGNGSVTYSNYDARGHAGRIVDGPNDLTFVFDRAEWVTQAKQTSDNKLFKEFTYATANGTSNWKNGKLEQAKRHNWSGTSDEQVTETYTYGGIGGRVSQRVTALGLLLPSSDTRTITQTFTWNDLGQVASLGYPDDGAIGDPARTVSYTYTNGFLTAVPSYATSISYHPNTMLNQVVHANGVTVTHGKDPDDLLRVASIATTGTAANWSTGTYFYDGAGNIKAIKSGTVVTETVAGRIRTAGRRSRR